MRLDILLLGLFIFAHLKNYGQQPAFSIAGVDSIVLQVTQHKENYEHTAVSLTDSTTAQAFFENGRLIFITTLDPGKFEKHTSWYYMGTTLLYTESVWTDAKGRPLYREKTYHNKNGLFAWLNTESTFMHSNSTEFQKRDRELSHSAAVLLDLVTK